MNWQSEAEFQRAVCDLAELHGWYFWHDVDSRKNKRGLVDLMLWRGPRIIAAELKIDRRRRDGRIDHGKTTEDQRVMLARFEATGAEAVVWRPETYVGERWHRWETAEPGEFCAGSLDSVVVKAHMRRFEFGQIERRLWRPSDNLEGYDALIAAAYLPPLVRGAVRETW